MEESNIWIIGIGALVIGALIGYLLGRSGGTTDEQEQLSEVKQELEDYKSKVANHFEETADLVNKMTESYRGVYQQLATGAQVLCDADTARSIESSMTPQLSAPKEVEVEAESEIVETAAVAEKPTKKAEDADKETLVEPPRDYAPKHADQEGTLSESYGLNTKNSEKPDVSEAVKKA